MRKPILLALAVALCASVGHAAEYWMTAGGPSEPTDGTVSGMLVAVDVSTIVHNGPERKAWVYLVNLKAGRIFEVTGVRYSYRCDQSESSMLQWVEFDPENLAIKRTTPSVEPSYSSPVPDSLPESVLMFVCVQRAGQPVTTSGGFWRVKGDDLSAVTSEGASYLEFMKSKLKASAPSN